MKKILPVCNTYIFIFLFLFISSCQNRSIEKKDSFLSIFEEKSFNKVNELKNKVSSYQNKISFYNDKIIRLNEEIEREKIRLIKTKFDRYKKEYFYAYDKEKREKNISSIFLDERKMLLKIIEMDNCIKNQKKAQALLDDILVFITDMNEHS